GALQESRWLREGSREGGRQAPERWLPSCRRRAAVHRRSGSEQRAQMIRAESQGFAQVMRAKSWGLPTADRPKACSGTPNGNRRAYAVGRAIHFRRGGAYTPRASAPDEASQVRRPKGDRMRMTHDA